MSDVSIEVPVVMGVPFFEVSDSGTHAVLFRMHDVACLSLYMGPVPVGSLRWDLDTGVVVRIEVQPEHQRKGYATMMWNAARPIAEELGWPGPLHDDVEFISDDGHGWIESLVTPSAESVTRQHPGL